MRYFCYLSQEKVDQFLAGYEERDVAGVEEKSERSRVSNSDIGLAKILTGKYSFGRTDMFHRDVKYREHSVQRLMRLLQMIGPAVEDFPWDGGPLKANFFYFTEGLFRAGKVDKSKGLVTIHSVHDTLHSAHDTLQLELYCSLKHFSSTLNARDAMNSTNGIFFAGKPLHFETVFFLTYKEDKTYMGTPLFLALSSDSNIIL